MVLGDTHDNHNWFSIADVHMDAVISSKVSDGNPSASRSACQLNNVWWYALVLNVLEFLIFLTALASAYRYFFSYSLFEPNLDISYTFRVLFYDKSAPDELSAIWISLLLCLILATSLHTSMYVSFGKPFIKSCSKTSCTTALKANWTQLESLQTSCCMA